LSLFAIPSASSTNLVTAILSPLSVNVPKDTIPEAVTFTAPVNEPELRLAVPSVNVVELTLVKPEIELSKFKVTWSPLTAEVMFVPPATVKVSPPSIVLVEEPSLNVKLV